jgi:methionyl-tRNA formyltransferase
LKSLTVVLFGSNHFGAQAFTTIRSCGHSVVAVRCPDADKRLGPLRAAAGIHRLTGKPLNATDVPIADLGVSAHNFELLPPDVIARFRHGVLAYHPSLLPTHRGRSAIEWALNAREPVTGGSWYWMDEGIDTGPVAYQDYCFVPHGTTPQELWRGHLAPLGIELLHRALRELSVGIVRSTAQPVDFATYERPFSLGQSK